MKRIVFALLFLIGLCATDSAYLRAQVTGGSLSGTLMDSAGAARPNVTITIENTSTNQRLTATTDANGHYRFTDVPPGHYRVISSNATTSSTPAVEVNVEMSQPATLNLTLPTGPATDTFMTGETVPTKMSTASIQNTYNERMVHYLPSPNFVARDGSAYGAYNLSLLSEAVTSGFVIDNRGPSVGGERPSSNNYHVDGIDNNNKVNPGPLVYVSNEATTDFSLFQNQPSPLFGHSSGGKFNSLIRNGSNGIHGSFYDYLQNRNLNAVDQQFSRLGIREFPGFDQNRLGGTLGIPIIPSKLFFFGNFEYIPLHSSLPFGGVAYAPTPAGFATLSTVPGVSATNLGILQSAVGTSVGPAQTSTMVNGVQIPLGLVNSTSSYRNTQYMGTGALDFTPWDKDRLSLRYVHNESDKNNVFGGLPTFLTPQRDKSQLASLSEYHTFANAVVNELRLGYNRYAQYSPLTNAATFPGLDAFPSLQIGQDTNLLLGQQFGAAQGARFSTYHLADNIAIRIRSHEINFGFDGRRYLGSFNGFASNLGNYSYSSLGRFLQDLPPDVAATQSFLTAGYSPNQYLLFGYITDTWTVSPKFTLDAGLRYEYDTVPKGLASQKFNAIASVPGLLTFSEPSSPARNFAPHVGIAISPFDNRFSVFRAGFGMYYDTLYGFQYPGIFAPQFGATVFGNLNSNTPGFFANGGLHNPNPGNVPLTAAQARAQTTTFVDRLRTPYSMQWNAAWEQAIWRNFTVELKYLGSKGVHLPVFQQLNTPGIVTAQQSLPLYYSAPSQSTLNGLNLTLNQLQAMQSTNPYVQAGFTNPLTTIAPDGNSWYHAAMISLNHRFTGGFQFSGNYTYSHLIDDSTGTAFDLASPVRIRANSLYDRRHVASATALWEVAPLFRNTYSIVRNVFADFSIGGTYSYATGQFVPITGSADLGLSGNTYSSAIFNPKGTAGVSSGVMPLFNSSGQIVAYQATNPNAQFVRGAAGMFNVANRAGIQLDDVNNWDLMAVKRFNVGDKASFELRGDAYNVFNHPQFTGSATNTLGLRYLTATPGFMVPGSVDFGNVQGTFASNARTLQVAARIVF